MNTPAAPFSCELKYFHHTTYLNHFLNPFLFDFKFSLTGQADLLAVQEHHRVGWQTLCSWEHPAVGGCQPEPVLGMAS